MNINPESKISLLALSAIVFGLVVWRISNSIFSKNNRIPTNKFDQSEFRKRWKRK
tara:strand:+ start:1032 stop:1196 length:165 start_codon:yes stop_codon:yes gene_type:complete